MVQIRTTCAEAICLQESPYHDQERPVAASAGSTSKSVCSDSSASVLSSDALSAIRTHQFLVLFAGAASGLSRVVVVRRYPLEQIGLARGADWLGTLLPVWRFLSLRMEHMVLQESS